MSDVDVLVVGAGFAGATVAERLAEAHGLRCLVVDRRDHVGGLAHDGTDRHGVLLHDHGPHWFRTDREEVRVYLQRFGEWRPAAYRIVARAEGRDWPFPINLATYERLVGRPATATEMREALERWREPIAAPRNAEEAMLARVGRRLYELFYRDYTRKQWGREPSEIDAAVVERIPVRVDRDDRAFTERFQALPADGYAGLFERMLRHPRIELRLGTDFAAVRETIRRRHLVYTGSLDELYGFDLGPLEYRSLRFERETFEEELHQPAAQVNYTDDRPCTRTVEPKHVTGQRLPRTTVVREFPEPHAPGRERYYPVPTPAARALFERYAARAAAERDATFVGRLATYRYLNMDRVVSEALAAAEAIGGRLGAGGGGA